MIQFSVYLCLLVLPFFTPADGQGNHSVGPETFQWQWSAPAAPDFRGFGAHCAHGDSWFQFGGFSAELQTCMHDLWVLSATTDPGEVPPTWSRLSSQQGDVPDLVVGPFPFPFILYDFLCTVSPARRAACRGLATGVQDK